LIAQHEQLANRRNGCPIHAAGVRPTAAARLEPSPPRGHGPSAPTTPISTRVTKAARPRALCSDVIPAVHSGHRPSQYPEYTTGPLTLADYHRRALQIHSTLNSQSSHHPHPLQTHSSPDPPPPPKTPSAPDSEPERKRPKPPKPPETPPVREHHTGQKLLRRRLGRHAARVGAPQHHVCRILLRPALHLDADEARAGAGPVLQQRLEVGAAGAGRRGFGDQRWFIGVGLQGLRTTAGREGGAG
jgi:hypothetical protein